MQYIWIYKQNDSAVCNMYGCINKVAVQYVILWTYKQSGSAVHNIYGCINKVAVQYAI